MINIYHISQTWNAFFMLREKIKISKKGCQYTVHQCKVSQTVGAYRKVNISHTLFLALVARIQLIFNSKQST